MFSTISTNNKMRSLERGQGFVEYAIIIVLIAIVAIPVVSILASPENFREGAIYQNIYVPIICRVQGQTADCQDIANYNYPVAGGPNGPKTATGSDGTGGGDDTPDPDTLTVTSVTLTEVTEGFSFTLTSNPVPAVAPGTYSIAISATTAVTSVDYTLTGNVAGSGTAFDRPFRYDSDTVEGALTDGDYVITFTPKRGTTETGDVLTINFTVDPSANPNLAGNLFVNGVSMIDADTGSNVGFQNTLGEGTWDFEPTFTDDSGTPASIRFELTGPDSTTQTVVSTTQPWQMFDGNGIALTAGTYTLTITPFDEFDTAGQSTPPQTITVTPPPEPISVTGFVLVDSDANTTGADITDGGSVLITGPVSFQANTEGPVQSVDIQLTSNGSPVGGGVDSGEPYSVFGDASGNYTGQVLVGGDYTLTAIPYRDNGGQGDAGDTVTVNFTIQTEGPAITGINLINADTDTAIGPLSNGDTLSDWTNISFQALANNETESVRIEINGVDGTSYNASQSENAAPYAAYGDSGGDYTGATLAAGEYEITVTGYSADNTPADQAGLPLTYRFSVVEAACTSYTLVRVGTNASCTATSINFIVRASCGPDTSMTISSPASFSAATITSSVDDGSVPEREQEVDFTVSVNTADGVAQADIDAVCNSGTPMDLTVEFADGTTQVYEYGNNLTTLQQK